jgi:hypothetical protein
MGFAMNTGLSWSRYGIMEGCCGHGDELPWFYSFNE